MLKIKEYIRAESLEQAYEWNQKKGTVVLGGMLWLKMQDRTVRAAVDLSGLGLDTIEETPEEFRIGAMVSLRQLEKHSGLSGYDQGFLQDALRPIVGVQFRNCATVGGSIFARFGFSDVLTAFLAMDTWVELYQGGLIPLEQFAGQAHRGDILVRLIVKKTDRCFAYVSQRNTSTDFPVLTCGVSKGGGRILCAVGARPQRAQRFPDEAGILKGGITEETARAFAAYVQERVVTGTNMRAGAEYRKRLTGTLVRRALLAMEGA